MTGRRKPKALIAWSSGKDSAWALHEIRRQGSHEIVGALTTVTGDANRVTVHGVREDLLRAQLDAAALPSTMVRIPDPCPNDDYAQAMAEALGEAKSAGVTHVVFGDLFLADLRAYREARLSEVGMTAVFPLWQRPTGDLAREMIGAGMQSPLATSTASKGNAMAFGMIGAGMQAPLATVDLKALPQSFAGRPFDATLLADLPAHVDPCGENGEFHSFAAAGPMFAAPIPVAVGETTRRDGFAYADLRPA
jgi:uncharacterized protein (TIGR00290 family)